MELNFAEICRVCLKEAEINTMISVFEDNISNKLMGCAVIQIWENDGLPEQICDICIANLSLSHEFKERCEKSDELLRQRLRRSQQAIADQKQQDKEIENFFFVDCTASDETEESTIENPEYMTQSTLLETINNAQNTLGNGNLETDQFEANAGRMQVENEQNDDASELEMNNVDISQSSDDSDNEMNDDPKLKQEDNERNEECSALYKCTECNKAFSRSAHLKEHVLSHVNTRQSRSSRSGGSKTTHKEVHLGEAAGPSTTPKTVKKCYVCPICNKSFEIGSRLKVHVKTTHGEKKFTCKLCDRSFTTKGSLKQHHLTHTQERPFACNVCDKRFTSLGTLCSHRKRHSNDKDVACSMCDKMFITRNDLNDHTVVHAKDKAFCCTKCDKRFGTVENLNTHMRKHSKERDFTCLICEQSFVTSTDLRDHCVTHAQDKPFGCKMCDKRFSTQKNLDKHEKIHI